MQYLKIIMSIFVVSEDANGDEKKTTGETATEPAADSSKAPDIDLPNQTRQVFYAENCVNMRQKLSVLGLKLKASQIRCMVNHFQLQASSRVNQGLRSGGDTHSLV